MMPLGTKEGLGSSRIVLHGDPFLPSNGAQFSPNFQPMSVVAKRSPISATAEHLLHFWSPVISLKGVRLGTLVMICRLILTSRPY